jgi:hypothetical protein
MKTPPKKKRDQKTAFRKKYGKTAGDLILSYRGKIAAQAKAKRAAATRASRD